MLNKFLHNSRNLFILGGLLAVAAFGLAFFTLSKAAQAPGVGAAGTVAVAPTPVPPPVLVAQQDIPAYTQITDSAKVVGLKKLFQPQPVRGPLPADYVQGQPGLDELLASGTRHLAINLAKGQPLTAAELVTNTTPGAIDYAPMLHKNEVAETVEVLPLAANNGNIQVGDHVNLLLTIKSPVRWGDTVKYDHYGLTFTDDNITKDTSPNKNVAYYLQSQTTMENLRVLNVTGNNYTVAMSPQEAVVFKFIKDSAATSSSAYVADLSVRSSIDSDKSDKDKTLYFTTDSITRRDLTTGKYTRGNIWK